MTVAFTLGRIIVGLYFLINAYNHVIKGSHMVGYAASKGVPAPKLAITGSGLLLLAGALSILSGVAVFWGLIALLVFMIPVTLKMHDYWKETDPMAKMNARIAFQKNMAIIGFLLMAMAIPTPWTYSL
ncbi:MAG TPA: DoxX family membrane protein [Candidatus Paceibacterota bacterium]|nr:DoxX family membrane protein [Candidatus Paceibacterota bacterium]